jgi:hypothetical protein
MTNWSYYRGIPFYGFYDFILSELFPESEQNFPTFRGWMSAVSEIHWACFFPEIAFISDYPKAINRNTRTQLHCETGPALEYRDTYALYYLNGVPVTKQIIETKPDDFTKEMVLGEANVDVRRELFRKIGIENFLKKIGGATIHAYKDYELIEVDFQDGKRRLGLKMKNPSASTRVHFERVADTCKTVQEALAWRNGMTEFVEPKVLT